MAVRVFDLTEPQAHGLTVVEAAPRRRQDVRRLKRRWAIYGLLSLVAPFLVAVAAIGVVR
ncbi:MAG: hypothetical protein WCG86_01730 [Actinomycetota bacterium]|jgi:hypothetical protein